MSELSDKLEYILGWLQSTNFEFFDCYNTGLSHQQIDEITKDLPFKLSDEVYQLYQWRNGIADLGFNNYYPLSKFLFPEQLYNSVPIEFYSLQEAVDSYKSIGEATSYYDVYWNQKWFPIGQYETKRSLYIVGDLNPSPVYLWDIGCLDDSVRVYKNVYARRISLAFAEPFFTSGLSH